MQVLSLFAISLLLGSVTSAVLPWHMGGHDARRSGQSQYTGTQVEYLAWTYGEGGTNLASVSVGENGTVYILTSSGTIDAVSPEGTREWSFDTHSTETNICTPALDSEGNIYVYADDLYALNATGHLLWTFPIPGITAANHDSSPALELDGDTLYFCDSLALYAVSLSSGEERWNFTAPDLTSSGPAIGVDGSLLVAGTEHVYAVDPTDGSLIWEVLPDGGFLGEVSVASDGTVLVGSSGNKLHAMTSIGASLWNYSTAGFISGRAAVSSAGRVIVADSTATLYCLSSAGELQWAYQTPTSSLSRSVAIGLDGVAYISGGSTLFAITPAGEELWSLLLSNTLGSAAIAADGTVYTGSNDALYAVNIALTPVPSSAPSSFPSVVCAGGRVTDDSQGQHCEECAQGEYSDGVQCHSCASGRTNADSGSSSCDLYVSTVDRRVVYAAAAAFSLCVLVSFVLSVLHGGRPGALLGVLLVTGDQISDILFSSQASFYNYSLLVISGMFCIIPLLPFAFIVLTRAALSQWRCVVLVQRMHARMNAWHEDNAGWLFHKLSFVTLRWNFFPSIVAMLLGDVLWPFVRVLFMILWSAALLVLQVLLLLLGVLVHATKLITDTKTNALFWRLWYLYEEDVMQQDADLERQSLSDQSDQSEKSEALKKKKLAPVANSIVLMEVVFESAPQLLVQCVNNNLAFGAEVWPTLAIVSITFSVFMIATVAYHFGFYMTFAEKRPFDEVPMFEISLGAVKGEKKGFAEEGEVDKGEEDVGKGSSSL